MALAEAIAAGDLVAPVQCTYPLDEVRGAFTELAAELVAGKIVLIR
jgi:NADPH:quinone reductase-like Zn-dependent oxidoreductase